MTITDAPATATSTAPTATTASSGNTYSVIGLVLSIVSIPLGMAPLAVAGIVLGFLGRTKEPAAITTANWAIVAGLFSLFGWMLFAVLGVVLFAPFAFTAWAVSGF
ncbi:MAG: hypothetical protein ABI435_07360 [Pseudolysinimonas sp.]